MYKPSSFVHTPATVFSFETWWRTLSPRLNTMALWDFLPSLSPLSLIGKHPSFPLLSKLLANLIEQEEITSSSATNQNHSHWWISQSYTLLTASFFSTLTTLVCYETMPPIIEQSYEINIDFLEQTQETLLGLWEREKMEEEEEEELVKIVLLFTY